MRRRLADVWDIGPAIAWAVLPILFGVFDGLMAYGPCDPNSYWWWVCW